MVHLFQVPHYTEHTEYTGYTIQSARLSIQSSELGLPTTSPAKSVVPPLGPRGETHSLAVEEVGGHNSDDGTDSQVL
jgi:hypothetical protein